MATKTPTKAEELREEASAKYKAAHDILEAQAEKLGDGKTADDIKSDDLSPEDLETFDNLMADGHRLREEHEAAAKDEGRWDGHRAAMDYYHGKATGKPGGFPWQTQTRPQVIERPKSLGEEFVGSEAYQQLVTGPILHNEQSKFRTEGVTVLNELYVKARNGDEEAKAQLKAATDIIQTESGGPGNALIIPQYLAGILPLPQRPLTVRELFAQGQATSDTVSYAAQSAFDDAAAAVAQATTPSTGGKPQSSISWARRTSPVETIATWMAATRQQLMDAGQTQSLIDNQGRLMLQLEEEDQLLSGDGNSPNLEGILQNGSVQTLSVASGGDNLNAIRTAKRLTMTGTARKSADAVVMHPYDSEQFDLLKDDNGMYRGGNPIGNFTFGQAIWGLPRVESEAISQGTVLVGAFRQGASVLERMPITVYTTDSHSDWFIRNLIAVLFEERLGFPIFFPTAFVSITLDQSDWGT